MTAKNRVAPLDFGSRESTFSPLNSAYEFLFRNAKPVFCFSWCVLSILCPVWQCVGAVSTGWFSPHFSALTRKVAPEARSRSGVLVKVDGTLRVGSVIRQLCGGGDVRSGYQHALYLTKKKKKRKKKDKIE